MLQIMYALMWKTKPFRLNRGEVLIPEQSPNMQWLTLLLHNDGSLPCRCRTEKMRYRRDSSASAQHMTATDRWVLSSVLHSMPPAAQPPPVGKLCGCAWGSDVEDQLAKRDLFWIPEFIEAYANSWAKILLSDRIISKAQSTTWICSWIRSWVWRTVWMHVIRVV